MPDPLSISAGIVGLLQAVKSLHDFMNSMNDAPETLTRARDDLKSTESVLEDLRQYLEMHAQTPPAAKALTDQKSALSSVLPQFEKLCRDFHKKLDSCVRRSAEGSKLAWTDRVVASLKKGSIEKFREEVSKARQLISLRVDMVSLLNAEQNTAALHDFQHKNETTMASIIQQLGEIDISMRKFQELSDESSEAMEKALRDQEVALKEQLLLCEENRVAADSRVRHEQDFGNTKAGDNARNLQILDLDKVKGSFKQKYGSLEIGNGTWSAQGAASATMVERFFYGPTAAYQPESSRGPGRRLGSNVATLDGIRSGSAPGWSGS
ncbi:nacht and ankyrin domain protein [Diplodia corticola]|uniref:Nacht and ankyrin domain protein n=1 Tax=Diplodia corticola TaxID=236234 RepID=A0A1J9R0E3_9PEZI|nr:nacht and ankyrin domain protein [Diplodia corticola]OJD34096.1 nacht and ankyrin domain protein [Diplodia corticola]